MNIELPSVAAAGKTIPHNTVSWSVHKNCHPNTDGSEWGWIEGAPGNITWSDNEAFNKVAAYDVAHRHNAWLEDQKPTLLKLIDAEAKQRKAARKYDVAKKASDDAHAALLECDREVDRLSMKLASEQAVAL